MQWWTPLPWMPSKDNNFGENEQCLLKTLPESELIRSQDLFHLTIPGPSHIYLFHKWWKWGTHVKGLVRVPMVNRSWKQDTNQKYILQAQPLSYRWKGWKGEGAEKQEGGAEAVDKTSKESIYLKHSEGKMLRENASHNGMLESEEIMNTSRVTQDAREWWRTKTEPTSLIGV